METGLLLAVFHVDRRGLQLESVSQLADAPRRRSAVRYAPPLPEVVVRSVRLPGGPARVRREALRFELRRLFPTEGGEWSAVAERGSVMSPRAEVNCAAIRTRDLEVRCRTLGDQGLDLAAIRPQAEALFHFVRWLRPAERRAGVVVDVRSEGVHVLLVEGDRWTVRCSADAILRAERIHLEIARLVSGVGHPVELGWVLLCGRPIAPETCAELAAILQLPLASAHANPWLRVAAAPGSIPPAVLRAAWPILIGLARAESRGGLNVLPARQRHRRLRSRIRTATTWTLAMLAAGLAGMAWAQRVALARETERAEQLAAQWAQRLEWRRSVAEADAATNAHYVQIEAMQRWLGGRLDWPRFLAEIQSAVQAAGEAWIVRLGPPSTEGGADRRLRLTGLLRKASSARGIDDETRARLDRLLAAVRSATTVESVLAERFAPEGDAGLGFELTLRLTIPAFPEEPGGSR